MTTNSPGGTSRDAERAQDLRWARIRRILERKVIPSLLLDPDVIVPHGLPTTEQDGQTDALMAMALQGRMSDAREDLRALYESGASFEQLQLGLLAPAAERLGVLWEEDRLSFVDVTIATGTLQQLMQFVAIDLADVPTMGRDRSICLFPAPGAEHTFGAAMAAKFFQYAGWHVEYLSNADPAKLRSVVQARPIDVIGVSVTWEGEAARAQDLIRDIKAAGRNPDMISIAGGAAFVRTPALITDFGVDAVVAAVTGAPAKLAQLVATRLR